MTETDKKIKMTFHFGRVPDADIVTEGDNLGVCYQKAIEEREKQFEAALLPASGGKIITEDKRTLVNPEGKTSGKLDV